ncbi:MAG: hypothetical protein O3A93_09890 [Chloroflexi bacterium]|nr:hypothetical protein [Chloroflexota bacterium]MDA1271552.1 hypothetical protein [Chloroflexota bacterium]
MKKMRVGMITALVAALALIAAVACGGNEATPLSTQPPPTETPVQGQPTAEPPSMVENLAPIEDTAVLPPAAEGGEYVLVITSGLPGGCATFSGYSVERDGNDFAVTVSNLMPDPKESIACTAIYGYHEGETVLGRGLTIGETYTVTVNGSLTHSFTALDDAGLAMVEKESPIEEAGVAKADGGYVLTVVSRLPKGSSCSRFNGYEINQRFAERIEVTVTHREVAEDNVPCTRDLPVVVTEIPLGGDFEAGRTYTVLVNGTEASFTAE